MRYFLNVIYDFEKSRNAFAVTLPAVREILRENNWNQERILFHFKDINDAGEEKSTSHSKMIRKFPQMKPYWNSDYEYYQAMNKKTVFGGDALRKRQTQPHQYSHFTNFPGWKDGKVEYMPTDDAITGELMEAICEKIPRPYSFYEAVVILDGIDWSRNCDFSPAIEWSVTEAEQEAGNWPREPMIDEAFPEYQSNSIRLAKRFDVGAQLDIQIELTDKQGPDETAKILDIFTKQFGTPTKQYVRARGSWEERGAWQGKKEQMQQFFDRWTEKTQESLSLLFKQRKEHYSPSLKPVSRKTMQKHFLEDNGLCRHEIRRWDDYGWYKALPNHYYYHLELAVNPKPQENTGYNSISRCMNFPVNAVKSYPDNTGHPPVNCMYLHCYGCNFNILCNVLAEDFISEAGDCAGEAAFWLFEEFLHRFEEDAVPEIAKIYGSTPAEFVQTSYARDFIHNQHCVTGIIEVLSKAY